MSKSKKLNPTVVVPVSIFASLAIVAIVLIVLGQKGKLTLPGKQA